MFHCMFYFTCDRSLYELVHLALVFHGFIAVAVMVVVCGLMV